MYILLITSPGHFLLKKIAQSQVSRITNTPIKIDQLRTDLFTYIKLNKVVLGNVSNRQSAVLVLNEMKIRYDFWKLFSKKIVLKDIQIDNPKIRIQKDNASNFNFPINLFNSKKDTLPTSAESQNGLKFEFHNLKIKNMAFSYTNSRDSMEINLNKMNFAIRSTMPADTIYGQLKINDGTFNLKNLSEQLLQCETHFNFANNIFDLTNFIFKTRYFTLQTSGQYNLQNQEIHAEKIAAQINLGLLNRLTISDSANYNEGIVAIIGRVNGHLNDPEAAFQVRLATGSIFNIPLKNVKAGIFFKNDELKLTELSLGTLTGQIVGKGCLHIKELRYEMNFSFIDFQLNQLFERLYQEEINHLQGIVSSDLSIQGSGRNWQNLIANGQIDLTQLLVRSQKFEDIRADISLDKGKLEFGYFQENSAINLTAQLYPDRTISGNFEGHLSEIEPLASLANLDGLKGKLKFGGDLNGRLNSPSLQCHFTFTAGNFQGIPLSNFTGVLNYANDQVIIKKGESKLVAGILFDFHSIASEVDSVDQIALPGGNFAANGKIVQGNINGKIVAEQIKILPIVRLFNFNEINDGMLNFDGTVYGNLNQPNFDLHLFINNINYKNKSIDSLHGEIKYFNNFLSVSNLSILKGDGQFHVRGTFPIDLYQPTFLSSINPTIQVDADKFDLNLLDAFIQDSISIGGKLTSSIEFQGNLNEPQLIGDLRIQNGKLTTPYFSSIDSMDLSSFFSGQHFGLKKMTGKISQFNFSFNGEGYYHNSDNYDASLVGNISKLGSFRFQANRQPDQVVRGKIQVDDLNLANLVQIVPLNQQLNGLVDISLDISGKQDSPLVAMILNSDQVGIEKARLDSVEIRANYANNAINIHDSGFRIAQGKINFRGNIPIYYPQRDSSFRSVSEINFHSYADNLDINWLRPLFPEVTYLQGKVNYDLKAAGSVANPNIDGIFNLQNGVVKFRDVNPAINGINISIHFDSNLIRIDNFSGNLETGNFKLQGLTHIKNKNVTDTKFSLALDKIKLASPKIFSLNIENGDVALIQTNDLFNLNGKILLKEAKYVQDYRPKISQFLTQVPNRAQADKDTFLNNVSLDVIIQGQENIWVENNLAKFQMSSNLNLVGTMAQPNISGRVAINKGYVLYLDRKFKITNGLIDFTDPHRINPFIDITATCTVTDYQSVKEKKYTITLKLSGLLEKPDFLLVSDPQLDKADIVAILTIGRTRENIFPKSETAQGQSFQQIMLNRFKEITSQRIAGMTEQQLSRTLALENVSIVGNLFQLDKSWGPRVTATKKLSDRINITYSTVVGHANEQQIKLGYKLFKNLSIVGNTGQTGQSGLDLRFQFKFY